MIEARRSRWGLAGLALLLGVYGLLLARNFAPAITEPDDNGYFAQGSLIAQTGRTWFTTESDAQFVGMHWLITPKDQYISRYPPGLAMVIAGVYKLFGYKASLLVNPALSVLTLVAVFLIARRLTNSGWALAAATLLAINPQFVHHALSGDSHMAVTCMLAWTIYFLARWSQASTIINIALAGLCFGCVPTIRYPDAVMALGVGAFLLIYIRKRPGIATHYVAFLAGACIVVIPLLIRNQLLLGAFWRTGYALTNEQTGFSWAYFRQHALAYVQSLNSGGVGLLLGLGVVGIVLMISMRTTRALGILFALTCLPMLLLYMAYYWAPQMNSGATMRFLLPTFPAYVLAGVWMLSTFLKDAPRGARVAVPLTLIVVQGLWGVSDLISETNRIRYSKQMLARVTDKLEEVATPGDVVVSNNQVLQNLDFVRKWKLADEQVLRGGPGGGRMGRNGDDDADAPSPMQKAKREEQMAKYPGSQSEREAKFARDVTTWAGDHNIYLVGSEIEVRDGIGPSGAGIVKILARVELPEPPMMPGGGGPGGGGMPGRGGGGGPIGGGFPGAARGRGRLGGMGGGPGGGGMGPGMIGPGGGFPGGPGGRRAGVGSDGLPADREIVIVQWIPNKPSAGTAPRHDESVAR